MLTTSSNFENNVLLDRSHINDGFDFKWNNSRFVNRVFRKFASWGPFTKIGEISNEGLIFIENELSSDEPVEFLEYLRSLV